MKMFSTISAVVFFLSVGIQGCVTSSTDAATALSATADNTSLAVNATTNVKGTGGTAPYSYFVSSGGGTIDASTGSFVAPSSASTVSIGVKDDTGKTVYVSLTVNSTGTSSPSSYPAITTTTSSVLGGGTLTLNASGGLSPYTFAIVSGAGSISGSTYTADKPTANETVEVQVTDSNANTGTYSFTVVAATTLTATSKVWADYQVGMTFDHFATSLDGAEYPEFVFFGTGSGTDNTALAYNGDTCKVGGNADVLAPCAIRIPLQNMLKTGSTSLAYKGTVQLVGRSNTILFEFCVRPSEPNRAYILWSQTSSLAYRSLNYNLSDRTLLGGRTLRGAYNIVDSGSGAAFTTINLTGSYTDVATCGSGYSSSHYIEASAN